MNHEINKLLESMGVSHKSPRSQKLSSDTMLGGQRGGCNCQSTAGGASRRKSGLKKKSSKKSK